MWDALQSALTVGLLRHEGESQLQLQFDLSGIAELQEDMNEVAIRAERLVKAGIITRNKALQMVGEAPVPDGDVYLLPINVDEQPVRTGG